VGKDTLLRRLIEVCPGIEHCVTYTTREPRQSEEPGVDYNFISRSEFEAMIEAGEFLEYAQVHLHLYGTPKSCVDMILDKGMDVILKIDVQGGLTVKEKVPGAVMIFVAPPSMEELEHRLRARYTDSEEAITKRLQDARREIECIPQYDYLVENDDLEAAVDKLRCIIIAERVKIGSSHA
jgi:guanylate kinase